MAEPTEKDPIDQLFAVYQHRTGESVAARFFRLRDEGLTSPSQHPLTSDAQDQAEEAFWAEATAHAARTWRGTAHE